MSLETYNYGGKAPYASDKTGALINTNQYGKYPNAHNNNGTILANGTVGSGVANSVGTARPVVSTFASTPIQDTVTVVPYAGKPVSGGTFLHNHVKPISHLITTELAGISNSELLSPSNDRNPGRSINYQVTLRSRRFTSAIRANKYNRVQNVFDAGYPVVTVDQYWDSTGNTFSGTETDTAALPTQQVPGRLVYMRGAKVPYHDAYKAKTTY